MNQIQLSDLQIKVLKNIIRRHFKDVTTIEGEAISLLVPEIYSELNNVLPFEKEMLTELQRISGECSACGAYRSEGVNEFCPEHRDGRVGVEVKSMYSFGSTSEVL